MTETQLKRVITWDKSDDGVLTLTIDDERQRVNTINHEFIESLKEVIERLQEEQASIRGVILRSGKSSFLAGGDLNRLVAADENSKDEFIADINMRKSLTLQLERINQPVVAVINGPTLGGGYELALCCHHIVAVDDKKLLVGLPESRLGLMPGAGGVVRTVRRFGLDQALDLLMLPGKKFTAREALEMRLVDEVASDLEGATQLARKRILEGSVDTQKAARSHSHSARVLPFDRATSAEKSIVAAANASLTMSTEQALRFESEVFGSVVVSPATKNMIHTHFFLSNELRKRAKSVALQASDSESQEQSVAIIPSDDFVGDGQRFAEVSWNDEAVMAQVASSALDAGVVPVFLSSDEESFSGILRHAFEDARNARIDTGITPENIDKAIYWAGLPYDSKNVNPRKPIEIGEVDLACSLLDEVAEKALAAVDRGVLAFPEDADAASVRLGGFPGWTRGITHWAKNGRTLAYELHRRQKVRTA